MSYNIGELKIRLIEDLKTERNYTRLLIKKYLFELYGDLGDLYIDNLGELNFTLKDWESAGGDEETYSNCKHIAYTLFQHAVEVDQQQRKVEHCTLCDWDGDLDGVDTDEVEEDCCPNCGAQH